MNYRRGNLCSEKKEFQLNIKINCDMGSSKTTYHFDESSILEDECSPRVIMNSPAGCPIFGMPPLWRWVENQSIMIGLSFLIIGAFLAVLGGKYYRVTLLTISSMFMFLIMTTVVFGIIMPTNTPQFFVWIMIVALFILGLGLGYGAYNWPKFGVIIIGFFTGLLLGTIIYTIFFGRLDQVQSND